MSQFSTFCLYFPSLLLDFYSPSQLILLLTIIFVLLFPLPLYPYVSICQGHQDKALRPEFAKSLLSALKGSNWKYINTNALYLLDMESTTLQWLKKCRQLLPPSMGPGQVINLNLASFNLNKSYKKLSLLISDSHLKLLKDKLLFY